MKRLDQCTTPEEVAAVREYARDYYQRNRDRLLAQSKAAQKRRYLENPEAILERNNRWRDANRERISAVGAQYYRANREAILARKKAQRQTRERRPGK